MKTKTKRIVTLVLVAAIAFTTIVMPVLSMLVS
jgi:hypothetical protein